MLVVGQAQGFAAVEGVVEDEHGQAMAGGRQGYRGSRGRHCAGARMQAELLYVMGMMSGRAAAAGSGGRVEASGERV